MKLIFAVIALSLSIWAASLELYLVQCSLFLIGLGFIIKNLTK